MRSVFLRPTLSLLHSRRNSLTDIETRGGIESHVFDKSTEKKDISRWEIRWRERRHDWAGGGNEQWCMLEPLQLFHADLSPYGGPSANACILKCWARMRHLGHGVCQALLLMLSVCFRSLGRYFKIDGLACSLIWDRDENRCCSRTIL
jgi:hypothetical protein